MRRTPVLALAALAALTLAAAASARLDSAHGSLPPLDISITAGPSGTGGRNILPGRPTGTYDCAFSVHEPGTKDLWAERNVTLRPGDRKSVTVKKETLSFTFLAEIDPQATFARLTLTTTATGGAPSTYGSLIRLCSATDRAQQ